MSMLRRAAGKGVFVPGSHIERDPEAPGDHEWPYRDKAIRYAFRFFRNMDMKTTPIYKQVASFDRKGSNIV